MELAEFEKKFLFKFKSKVPFKPNVTRTECGMLSVSIEAPCDEVGHLTAYLKEDEIILDCKVSHDHFFLGPHIRAGVSDPLNKMLDKAVQSFSDFINDKIVVSSSRTEDGKHICASWGSIDAMIKSKERRISRLQKAHKCPIVTEHWVWSGKYEIS